MDFQLQLVGVRNVKAARAILADDDSDDKNLHDRGQRRFLCIA